MTATFAPVIVFSYNRPEHLRRTLEALAAAEGATKTALWIFCDGPKSDQDSDLVAAVRKVAQDSKWSMQFASVVVTISDINKGLAESIIGGVTQVIDQEGRVVVLEDDLIVSPDFLCFINKALIFYRDDTRVGMVTGFCPLKKIPHGYNEDVMAVPRNSSQGWATWVDRWKTIDWNRDNALQVLQDAKLRRSFRSVGSDQLWRLYRQLKGRINSWSIRADVWLVLTNRYTIYPVHNRIRNIGYDGSGVHTRPGEEKNLNSLKAPRTFRLSHIESSPAVLKAFRQVYSGSVLGRILRDLRMWLLSFGAFR